MKLYERQGDELQETKCHKERERTGDGGKREAEWISFAYSFFLLIFLSIRYWFSHEELFSPF